LKNLNLYIVIFWLAIGCDQPILLDLEENPDLFVVEGWITDQADFQSVRITKTSSFSDNQNAEVIENATVQVEEIGGQIYQYTYDGNGNYRSNALFSGRNQFFYQLEITTEDNITIKSSIERLVTVRVIDSLWYDFFLIQDPENIREQKQVYFPIIRSSDPVNEDNYYWWKAYRNGEYLKQSESIYLLSDRFFNGSDSYINNFPIFNYEVGDSVTLEKCNISKRAFEYLSLLKSQTTSLGTNSGNSPATLKGNLINQTNPGELVLGYFGTISIKASSVIIEELENN